MMRVGEDYVDIVFAKFFGETLGQGSLTMLTRCKYASHHIPSQSSSSPREYDRPPLAIS